MTYEPIRMRRFVMERMADVSGTSGEGPVVEGVQFTDGKVVFKWRTAVSSIVIWDNIESAALIHGHGGNTIVRWIDGPNPEFPEAGDGASGSGAAPSPFPEKCTCDSFTICRLHSAPAMR